MAETVPEWLEPYKEILIELNTMDENRLADFENFDALLKEFENIFEPVIGDKSIDPGDMEEISRRDWEKNSRRKIHHAKKYVDLQLNLMTF